MYEAENVNVNLIGLTYPVKEGLTSPEDLIAYCARVSNPKNQHNFDTAGKLLQYMIRNKHWSPFEMVHVVMEINSTRDIVRQILRHRSFSFQEFSQRYAEVEADYKVREARLQDEKNRQNSLETADEELKKWWSESQVKVYEDIMELYHKALEKGIAKEQARVILPEGMTPSQVYMAGSVRSWIHYCMLRMGNGTQKEHQEVATACWKVLKKEFKFLKEIEL